MSGYLMGTLVVLVSCVLAGIAYHREWDLLIGRRVMHLFGIHTNACRGHEACAPISRPIRLYRNGWWRR